MATTTHLATPAGRFRRAAKDLAKLGIQAELVRSCCRGCATYEATAGTKLLAVEFDGSGNEPSGWFRTFGSSRTFGTSYWDRDSFDHFRAYLVWETPDGWTTDEYLDSVLTVLRVHGLDAERPESEHLAILVQASK